MDEYKLLTEELCTSFGGEGWHELINLLEAGYRGEFVALRYLRENGRETVPGELAKQMRISTARVAAILKSLARKKYICRTRSEKDGRSFIVRATAEGLQALERREREVHTFIEGILRKLSAEDAQTFLRLARELFN